MLPYRDSRLTKIALVVFFLLVIGYAYFEAQGLLFGPSINISSNEQEVHDPFITIKGKADRISSLSMNGKEVRVTEDGAFEEPYLLAKGLNQITLEASDKYGRKTKRVIQIVYAPSSTIEIDASATTTSPLASSTPPMAQ